MKEELDIINEYELLAPFQSQDAGLCRWTFAKRRGKDYFIKEFLDPKYPLDDALSEKLKKARIADCVEFEEQRKKFYSAINQASDGNLVHIFEFFRADSRYYITMEKINGESLAFEEIAKLPLNDRILICRIAAHGMMRLHEQHIVHADIKDTNVLLYKTGAGKIIPKIIDFDCGFFESNPPESEEELGGDQVYLSPEACQFWNGEDTKLTCKMDVFSLGLLFHQYLTGSLPDYDITQYDYAHEAVLDGQELVVSSSLPSQLRKTLSEMLIGDPDERTTMAKVYGDLGLLLISNEKKANTSTIDSGETSGKLKMGNTDWFHNAGNL